MNKSIKLPVTRLKDLSVGGLVVAIAITSLNAEIINKYVFTNPLPANFKAIDNGGTKAAIDAYKDGVGVVVLDNLGQNIQIDNSAMNTLVYKYGEAAKASGSTIVDEVMYGSGTTNTKDKVLVGRLTVDGATCSDGNVATQGETWLNGNCQGGISTNGTPCNDGDPKTINDIYTDGVCAGTNVEGQSCTDDNFLTIKDKYIDGVCVGTLTANGQTCNDNNVMTINDIYTNGVCAGTLTVNGQSCSDGLVMTVNDIYTNGVCAGTLTVNGTTCTHSDVKVVNETWLNGVCTGTLTVNGATCTHSDVKVVNETWLNGVCAGTLTVNGTTCSDGNAATLGDKWLNGVCIGYTNGTTCNDNIATTYGDIYTNGICAGFANGTACNDNNANTSNDKYTSGICAGTPLAFTGTPTTLTNANKATFTYTMRNSYWSQTGAGLFDNTIGSYAYHTENTSVYWGYGGGADTSFQITVNEPFKIWRVASNAYSIYSGTLQILRLEGGVYVDRTTNYHLPQINYGYAGSSTQFELFTTEMPAGTYRFNGIDGQYRIDYEWFIEKKI